MASIYIIGEPGSDVLKIGISVNPAHRLRDIKISNPSDVEVLWEQAVDNARRVERNVHLVLVDLRIRGEWFKVSLREAVAVVEKIIAKEPENEKEERRVAAWEALAREAAAECQNDDDTIEYLSKRAKRLRFPRV